MILPRYLAILLLAVLVAVGIADQNRSPNPVHRAELLEAGDVRIRAIRAGAGEPTLVLLHGFGEHLMTWRMILDPLARDHRVIALDLPGLGGSDKPAGPYTVDAMAGRLIDFLERWAEPPVVLVGHSMGGQLAATIALRRPDLVSHLVLIAPAGYRVGLAGIATEPGPARASAVGVWEAARAFLTPLRDPDWVAEPEGLTDYDPGLDPRFAKATRRILLEFAFEGLGDGFRAIRQPTLMIWGTLDPVIPHEVADTILRMLPCARLVSLEQTMHRPQVERHDTVITLIRQFLDSDTC